MTSPWGGELSLISPDICYWDSQNVRKMEQFRSVTKSETYKLCRGILSHISVF